MTRTESVVIAYARESHKQVWTTGSDVSEQTRSAQAVCKVWQDVVCREFEDRFVAEHPLGTGDINEKIDLLDTKDRVAYELKVSENNPHMELYRDIFKALVFNRRNPKHQLLKLIFITPEEGAAKLDKAFGEEVKAIALKAGLVVEISPI